MTEKELIASAKPNSKKIFFDDGSTFDKVMHWMYDTWQAWPGGSDSLLDVDELRILVACKILMESVKSSTTTVEEIKDVFNKHLKSNSGGAVSAIEDTVWIVTKVNPLIYITAEDYMVKAYHDRVDPQLRSFMASDSWSGCYGFGGLTYLLFQSGREPLMQRYRKYVSVTSDKVRKAVTDEIKSVSIEKLLCFVTLVDDAAGHGYYLELDDVDQAKALDLAYWETYIYFEIYRARKIGGDLAKRVACKEDCDYFSVWMEHTVYGRGVHFTVDELDSYIEDRLINLL